MPRLQGRTIAVTRAVEQAGTLVDLLRAEGAEVVEVPTIQIVEPADGGAALREAVDHLDRYSAVVVTSTNGAARLAQALDGRPTDRTMVAVVGPGTADVLAAYGIAVDLVPDRFVGEGLVAEFPNAADGARVLLAQAEAARPVVADGLSAKGWQVDVVVAYRTVPAELDPALVARAAGADAITFTSSSTVANYLHRAGAAAVPPVVVCIGPVTAATAAERGLHVTRVATQHNLEGLVSATVDALAS
jgi:uroporphyrinogen-III synthase